MLRDLSNTELTEKLKSLIQKEREVLNQVLEHLEEMERRRLYLKLGFSSLFEYCLVELGYSEGAAQRRISSMRLIKEIPQAKEKLETGELNLTTLSMAQSFFKREEKEQRTKYTSIEKHELLKTLEAKSKREVEKELIKISPLSALPKEKERLITSDRFEIKFTVTQNQMNKLNRLKELKPNLVSNQEALDWLLDRVLKQIDPMEFTKSKGSKTNNRVMNSKNQTRKSRVTKKSGDSTPKEIDNETNKPMDEKSEIRVCPKDTNKVKKTSLRKYISRSKKAFIWKNAKAQCEYVSPITQKRCSSRSNLQIDHIQPIGLGGTDDITNLRLLCQQHNLFEAVEDYGSKKMNSYLKLSQRTMSIDRNSRN